MVPAITTNKRKDGTKKKYRYYVCSNFHNKGSSACRANSIKAYDAEYEVINKIEKILSNQNQLFSKLQSINTTSIESLNQLNSELKQLENRLSEIQEYRIVTWKHLSKRPYQ
nr:zinc ribbon domain-containing protein [Bacillus licheniformis]